MNKPIIGVFLRYFLSDNRPTLYMTESTRRTIQKAGGFLLVIPPVQDVNYIETKGDQFEKLTDDEKMQIEEYLKLCDGLFFPGGSKFTPYDRYLLERAVELKIPTLGVCLSMQMMSCYQEEVKIEENKDTFHEQEQVEGVKHKVHIKEDSKLYQILGTKEIMVNSFHHYHALKNSIYKTSALSEDGVIEGLEYPGDFFHIGVQWHPEINYQEDIYSKKIIDCFIDNAVKYKNKKLHIDEEISI